MAASEFEFKLSTGESVEDAIGNTIVLTEEEFYLSDSPTELSGGEWSTSQPTWTAGKYIWRRTKNTYNKRDENGEPVFDYTPSETGVCITGNSGADAESSVVIKTIPEMVAIPVSSDGIVEENYEFSVGYINYKGSERSEHIEAYIDEADLNAKGWGREFAWVDGNNGDKITIPKGWSSVSNPVEYLTYEVWEWFDSDGDGEDDDNRLIILHKVPVVFVRNGESPYFANVDCSSIVIPVSASGVVKEAITKYMIR